MAKTSKKKAKKKTAKKKAAKKTRRLSPTPPTPSQKKANEKTAEEELTTKQKLFGDEYLKDLNGARAYADVYKCSLRAAGANASRLIQTVRMRAYLQRKIANMQTSIDVNIENILRECGRIALADPINAYNDDGGIRKIQDIPIDLRRAISGFEVEELFDGKGKKRKLIGYLKKIKFWSKDSQLELLSRHLGLLEKDNVQRAFNLVIK